MEKLVKLIMSPNNPAIENAGDIILKIHVPCSEKDVTIQVNPYVREYTENNDQLGIQIRQTMATTTTDQTKILHFDFINDNIQTIIINNKKYEIKLMHIGKENIQGQDFPYYEFLIRQ